MKSDNPIILALDYSDVNDARKLLSQVRPNIGMIKIGLELFTASGKEALELSNQFNVPIFLDLKLHDVPTTVSKTVSVVCQLLSQCPGDHFLSIHCFGGGTTCEAALKAASGSNVTIAGVTALTSLEEDDFWEMGFRTLAVGKRAVALAEIGADCSNITGDYQSDKNRKRIFTGLKHFVCAPDRLKLMISHIGEMNFICPGIRADGEETHDHKKTKPIGFALRSGATWVVVGRPITQAVDPVAASAYFKSQADKWK